MQKSCAHDFHKPFICANLNYDIKSVLSYLLRLLCRDSIAGFRFPLRLSEAWDSLWPHYSDDVSGEPSCLFSLAMRASPGRLAHLYLAARLHPDDVVLTVVGLRLPPPSRACRVPAHFSYCLTRAARRSDLAAPRPLPLVQVLGYALNGSMSKTVVCLAMLAGLEPAPSDGLCEVSNAFSTIFRRLLFAGISIMCGAFAPAPWRYCSSMRSMLRWLYA